MKYTGKLGLNLVEGADKLSPKAINENTEKIGKELDYHAQGYQLRATEGGDPLYTVVETVKLSSKKEGDTIRLVENGRLVEFLVAQKDYGAALDGAGKTLLVRSTPTAESWLHNGVYGHHTWLDSAYRASLGSGVKKAIQNTTVQTASFFEDRDGNVSESIATSPRGVFALSATELGLGEGLALGTTLATAAVIKSKLLTAGKDVWLRSTSYTYYAGGELAPLVLYATSYNGDIRVMTAYANGTAAGDTKTAYGLPAFAVPNDFEYTLYKDGTVYYDEQAYGTPRTAVFPYGSNSPVATLGQLNLVTGSYVGNGKACSFSGTPDTLDMTNATVIQFPVKPKLWGVYAKKHSDSGYSDYNGLEVLFTGMLPWVEESLLVEYPVTANADHLAKILVECTQDNRARIGHVSGPGLSSYSAAEGQLNEAACEYFWWALY